MPHPETVLIADVPLFPLGQELFVCQWLHRLTERELTYWPRRHVLGTPLVYASIPDLASCTGVYTVMLCLN